MYTLCMILFDWGYSPSCPASHAELLLLICLEVRVGGGAGGGFCFALVASFDAAGFRGARPLFPLYPNGLNFLPMFLVFVATSEVYTG